MKLCSALRPISGYIPLVVGLSLLGAWAAPHEANAQVSPLDLLAPRDDTEKEKSAEETGDQTKNEPSREPKNTNAASRDEPRDESRGEENQNAGEAAREPGSSQPGRAAPSANENRAGSSEETDDTDPHPVIDGIELWERADDLEQQLSNFRAQLQAPESVDQLKTKLEAESRAVIQETEAAREDVRRAARWFIINNFVFRYSEKLVELARQRAPFDRFVEQVGNIPVKIRERQKEWEEIQSTLRDVGAPLDLRKKANSLLVSLRVLRLEASRAESTISHTRSLIERTEAAYRSVLNEAVAGRPTLLDDFTYVPDEELEPAENFAAVKDRVSESFAVQTSAWWSFLQSSKNAILLHLALTLGLIAAALRARWYYRKHAYAVYSEGHLFLDHPIAGGLLLGALGTVFLYPVVPVFGLFGVLCVATGTALILLQETRARDAWTIFGLVALIMAHVLLTDLPRVDRGLLLLEGLFVLFTARVILRLPYSQTDGGWGRLSRIVAKVWMVACAIGIVCWMFSFSTSAAILIDGTARVIMLTLAYRLAYEVASSLVQLACGSPWARTLNAFAHHRHLIARRIQFVIRWALVFLWGRSLLRCYTLLGSARRGVEGLLDATLSAGTLDFSVRSLVVLAVGVGVAVATAKLVRFALAEDVMPRTGLRVGTWTAVTSSTYYVVLGFGVFTALAAAGVELDRLTILVSALGVGIGFGLQNIVQNFISGVILMLERPVNVGDKIEVEQMFGVVQTIGFRASRVRTFDGAEVIVPNSDLIQNHVVNWSLSDDRRRIEVLVGVKYGTDPTAVLDLLVGAAAEHPDVLKDPAPDALFWEFGDSSLNFRLRCHTDSGSDWMRIKSDLTVSIDAKLAAAAIEIPFPQRDLHLRSVEESLQGLVSSKGSANTTKTTTRPPPSEDDAT